MEVLGFVPNKYFIIIWENIPSGAGVIPVFYASQ